MEALEFLKKYLLLDEQESKEPQWIRIANLMDAYHKQKLKEFHFTSIGLSEVEFTERELKLELQRNNAKGLSE